MAYQKVAELLFSQKLKILFGLLNLNLFIDTYVTDCILLIQLQQKHSFDVKLKNILVAKKR